MKMRGMILLVAMAMLGMVACEKEDEVKVMGPDDDAPLTRVNFTMDASSLGQKVITRGITPSYEAGNFGIYAFKQNQEGTDYVCNKIIDCSAMTYDPTTKRLSGSVQLPIGTYKFLPSYGLTNAQNIGGLDAVEGATLNDALGFTHEATVNTLGVPEVFLANGTVAGLTSYDLGTTSGDEKNVGLAVTRAVARVDVLLLKADDSKNPLPYTNGSDVFGKKALEKVEFRLTNLNKGINFLGVRPDATLFDATIVLPDPNNAATVGTGAKTVIGEPDFTRYDSIRKEDLLNGSAHICGPYLLPGNDATATAQLVLFIKPVGDTGREVTLTNALPLERNKVTLVKIYVKGDDFFTTGVILGVDIDTAWADEHHEVEGEVS